MTRSVTFGIVVSMIVAATLGITIYQATDNLDRQWHYNATEAHCQAHNGETYTAMVWGGHGGTHCQLPNGTTIHYHDIPDTELEEYHPRPKKETTDGGDA